MAKSKCLKPDKKMPKMVKKPMMKMPPKMMKRAG